MRGLVSPLAFCALLAVTVSVPTIPAAPPKDSDLLAVWPHPQGYVCYRASKPIVIDGDLKDEAWDDAPWSEDFVDIEGDKRQKPRFRTRMKMLWDNQALYIAAEMEEPHLWGTIKEHDAVIFHDNDFEVFLDPDGDNHHYGELELNALNTTWDLLLTKPYKDGGRALNAWEITGLKTAVKINGTLNNPADKDVGWTLEIRWPLEGLQELTAKKIDIRDGDQWRINFSRVEWDMQIVNGKYEKIKNRLEHNWVWSPQGVIDMHRPERWGYLQFSTAKPGTAKFAKDPDWTIRDTLHQLYYANRIFKTTSKTGEFATKMQDLGLKDDLPIKIETTRSGYEATWFGADKKPLYSITQDARIWKH